MYVRKSWIFWKCSKSHKKVMNFEWLFKEFLLQFPFFNISKVCDKVMPDMPPNTPTTQCHHGPFGSFRHQFRLFERILRSLKIGKRSLKMINKSWNFGLLEVYAPSLWCAGMPIFHRTAESRVFCTKIFTPEIRLWDNFWQYGGSLKLLTDNGNSPSRVNLPVVPLFFMTSRWHPWVHHQMATPTLFVLGISFVL